MKVKVFNADYPTDHKWTINGIEGVFVNGIERDVPDDAVVPAGPNITCTPPVGLFGKSKVADKAEDVNR